MQLNLFINAALTPYRWQSMVIDQNTDGRVSTAEFERKLVRGVDTFPVCGAVVAIQNSVTLDWVFTGKVVRVEPQQVTGNHVLLKIACQDYTYLLETAIITTAVEYTGQTDQFVIQALFAAYFPEINTSLVAVVETLASVRFVDVSLAEALRQISQLTGAVWYLTPTQYLRYFAAGTQNASFELSDTPNNVTVFPYLRNPSYQNDFSNACNSATVLGALKDDGTSYTGQYFSIPSQSLYGTYSRTVVDRNIQSDGEAALRAEQEVVLYAYPQASGVITFNHDGLLVGQSVIITCVSQGMSGYYVTRSLRIQQITNTRTHYTAQVGAYRPDIVWQLREIARRAKQPTELPEVIPLAPGDVTIISITKVEDGVNIYLTLTYSPPGTNAADIGTFSRVGGHVQAPDGSATVLFAGNYDYNGVAGGVGAARYGTCVFVFPQPVVGATWRAYLTSGSSQYGSNAYMKTLVLDGLAGETPNITIPVGPTTVKAAPLAPNQTPVTVGDDKCRVVLVARGNRTKYKFSGSVTFDTANAEYEHLDKLRIVEDDVDGPVNMVTLLEIVAPAAPSPATGVVVVFNSPEFELPAIFDDIVALEFQALNMDGVITPASPRVEGLVIPCVSTDTPGGGVPLVIAPVTGFTVVDDGMMSTGEQHSFTWGCSLPASLDNFSGVKITITTTSGSPYVSITATGLLPPEVFISGYYSATIFINRIDLPGASENWTFRAVTVNAAGDGDNELTTAPTQVVSVGPPVGTVPDFATPADVAIIAIDESNNGLTMDLDVEYEPPGTDENLGTFVGVETYIEAPDASGYAVPGGGHDYDGDASLVGTVNTTGTAVAWVSGVKFPTTIIGRRVLINAVRYLVDARPTDTSLTLHTTAGNQSGVAYTARTGKLRLALSMPATSETWRIYLASKSEVYKKKLVLYGITGATPSSTIAVTALMGGELIITLDGIGVTY